MKKIVFIFALIPFMSVSLYGMEAEKKKPSTPIAIVNDLWCTMKQEGKSEDYIQKSISTLVGTSETIISGSPKTCEGRICG